MEILRFTAGLAEAIGWRPYEVELASSIKVAEGEGEAHAYVIYFEPGGVIGPHEAGFCQILLALAGRGWVAGADDRRVALAEGAAAFISRGEIHSKGSKDGMTAFMIQVRDLTPLASWQPNEPHAVGGHSRTLAQASISFPAAYRGIGSSRWSRARCAWARIERVGSEPK